MPMRCFVRGFATFSCLRAAFATALGNFDPEIPDWCEDTASCESRSAGAEHVLLQKSQISKSSNFQSRASGDMESPRLKASEVPLSEEGYRTIAKLKNEREMAAFIKRVSTELGFEITEEAKLNGVVPYYNGKKATQSFAALTTEMSKTSNTLNGWAKKRGAQRWHAQPSGQILLQTNQQIAVSKAVTNKSNSSAEFPMKAAEVSLNEKGYRTIANLKDEKEMLYFVKRAAEELGYEISDIGSLHGVVPYYSGKKATQSFVALEDELARTSKQPKGWAKKSQKRHKADLIETQLHVSEEFDGNVDEEHASEKKHTNAKKEKDETKKHDDKKKVQKTHKSEKKEAQKKKSKKFAKNVRQHAVVHARKEKRDVVKSKQTAKKTKSSPTASKGIKSRASKAEDGETHHKASSKSKPKRSLSRIAPTELDETMLAKHAKSKVNPRIMPEHKDLITASDKNTLHVVGKVKVQKGSSVKSTHASAAPHS